MIVSQSREKKIVLNSSGAMQGEKETTFNISI